MKACSEAIEWVSMQNKKDPKSLLQALIIENQPLEWGNWFIARVLERPDKIKYAVYAAALVLHIYEDRYPEDKRPRMAIAAARRYLKNPTEKNKAAAYAAYIATDAAAYAVYTAADPAAYAAYIAADAAADTVAAVAADAATYAAADAAADAAGATNTRKEIQIKILKYGVRLINGT